MYQVRYPGSFLSDLSGAMRPFVLLEVGSARVTPFLQRDMSSFVHDLLIEQGLLGEYTDNRPAGVRCVHPLVTLLEKLDAILRRFPRAGAAATFVRHYEDAARIIRGLDAVPELLQTPQELAEEMLKGRQLRRMPISGDPAFRVSEGAIWDAIQRASTEIHPMFWGARISLEECCREIRGWLISVLGE